MDTSSLQSDTGSPNPVVRRNFTCGTVYPIHLETVCLLRFSYNSCAASGEIGEVRLWTWALGRAKPTNRLRRICDRDDLQPSVYG